VRTSTAAGDVVLALPTTGAGTDIKLIQELLGHNDLKTTLRYTHVSNRTLEKIKSPFDNLNLKE
jgi:site-specific recombinase XerD